MLMRWGWHWGMGMLFGPSQGRSLGGEGGQPPFLKRFPALGGGGASGGGGGL